MLDYLKNILPRLKQHGQALDRKELFSDQPWVIIDEDLNKQQIIFKRDGRLLMSHNGQGFQGTWEYLPEVNGLWIDRGFDKLLLNQGFYLDGVMILKKDGVKDDPVFFANPNKVPDLDVPKYLEPLLREKVQSARIEQRIISFPLESGEDLDIYDCSSLSYIHNNVCKINEESPADGTYKMMNDDVYFIIEGGRVNKVIYRRTYATDLGDLAVEQSGEQFPRQGDFAHLGSNQQPTGKFRIKGHDLLEWIQVLNGQVVTVRTQGEFWEFLPILLVLLLIVLGVIVFVIN